MNRHVLVLPGLLCLLSGMTLSTARAQAPFSSVNSVYAVVGARIEVGNGKVIEKGTVLVRDGMIEAVGVDVKVPPEAEIIKGDGLTVYPGFIDAHSTRGLTLPDAQPTQDVAPDISAGAPPFMREANRKGIRPELRAGDYLTLTDEMIRPARASGFTTEMIMPTGGTINGMGTLVNLTGMPRRDSIVRPDVAMNFTFRTTGSGYPGSLMGIQALTRQTLLDAQYFQMVQTAFTHGGSHRPPADESLAALMPVLNGSMPVLFDADSENEIRRAIRMADEFNLKLMLSGGTEAYKALPVLSQRKIPVIVSLDFGQEPGVTAPAGQGTPGGFRRGRRWRSTRRLRQPTGTRQPPARRRPRRSRCSRRESSCRYSPCGSPACRSARRTARRRSQSRRARNNRAGGTEQAGHQRKTRPRSGQARAAQTGQRRRRAAEREPQSGQPACRPQRAAEQHGQHQ